MQSLECESGSFQAKFVSKHDYQTIGEDILMEKIVIMTSH
jgi:hypothetical protein